MRIQGCFAQERSRDAIYTVIPLGICILLLSLTFSACSKERHASPEAIPQRARPLGQPGKSGLEQTGGKPRDFVPSAPASYADPGARRKAAPGNQMDAAGRQLPMGE